MTIGTEGLHSLPGLELGQAALRLVLPGAHAAHWFPAASGAMVAVLLTVVTSQGLLVEGTGVKNPPAAEVEGAWERALHRNKNLACGKAVSGLAAFRGNHLRVTEKGF